MYAVSHLKSLGVESLITVPNTPESSKLVDRTFGILTVRTCPAEAKLAQNYYHCALQLVPDAYNAM